MKQPTQEDLATIAEAVAQGRTVDAPITGDLRYRTFPGFDPTSGSLFLGMKMGHCLSPAFDFYGIFIFESALTPCGGSFVLAELRSLDVQGGRPLFLTKLLSCTPEGDWRLIANDGVTVVERVKDSMVQMATLVGSIEFGPEWPRTNDFEVPSHLVAFGFTNIVPACPLWSAETPPSIDSLRVRHLPGHPRSVGGREFPPLTS